MKIYDKNSKYTSMSKKEKEQVSVLKLSPDRKHVKGVGMKDGRFFVLVEKAKDDEYLSFVLRRHRKELRNKPSNIEGKIIKAILKMCYSLKGKT
jgi:hypothetical protein|tara:strand:- start:2722 stop:3003 length:282 start_codon:yes stop_codon:yes gene_type:complete